MKISCTCLLLFSLCAAYCQNKQPGDTISEARKKLSDSFYKKGNTYWQGCPSAQKYYDSAIQANPNNADAWREKSVFYLKSGQFQVWAPLMNKAVELAPITYLGVRARCLLHFLRDYDRVIEDVDRLQKLVPNLTAYTGGEDPYYLRALAYLGKKDYQKALENLDQYVSKYLQQYKATKWVYAFAWTYRAVCNLQLGAYDKAIKDCDTFIEVYPNHADGWYWKGKALAAKGERKEAEVNFKKALSLLEEGRQHKDVYVEVFEQLYPEDITAALQEL